MRGRNRLLLPVLGLVLLAGVPARRAEAHCDSLDGPVVQAARRALALGDPAPALAWVQPEEPHGRHGCRTAPKENPVGAPARGPWGVHPQ